MIDENNKGQYIRCGSNYCFAATSAADNLKQQEAIKIIQLRKFLEPHVQENRNLVSVVRAAHLKKSESQFRRESNDISTTIMFTRAF